MLNYLRESLHWMRLTFFKPMTLEAESKFKALLAIAEQDLQLIHDVKGLVNAANILKAFPTERKGSLKGLSEAQRRINMISSLAQDYQTRLTSDGQLKVLAELHGELIAFRSAMYLTGAPVGTTFLPLAAKWLELVETAEDECRWQLYFTPIPNPFIVGNPVKKGEEEVFKGRRDIIVAIEENIINAKQRPALLLYGRRRTGKSSTLLNLPRLMSSHFVPVFIDCQNAKQWASDEEFCYHLATAISHELFQRNLLDGLRQPRLEQFEKYAFTRLDEFLDRVEALSRKINKQILLTFDEYERLELGITNGKISEAVLNQLRTIIQHRERLVVLVSGSHRFEELKTVNWSDYLINAKTLELSYLARDEARALLTEPVPNLRYDEAVLDEILDVTHCQPFLLQAVASDLVNYLNGQKRQHATMDDLAVAVEKVLGTADNYFYNTWNDCSAAEQEVLRALVTGQDESRLTAELQAAVQSLRRKEIVEHKNEGYRLSVELFGRWIRKNQLAESLPATQNEWLPANQTYELPTPYNSYGAAEILSKELQQ